MQEIKSHLRDASFEYVVDDFFFCGVLGVGRGLIKLCPSAAILKLCTAVHNRPITI